MAHASDPLGTIDPREAAHFGRLAADWWDPKGSSALLHRLNPIRLRYSGVSFAFNFGGILGGAATPILAQLLSGAGLGLYTGLLLSVRAARQVAHFLANGRFAHGNR